MMAFGVYTNIAATTAAVTNRFVTSTNMVNAAYTLANTTPVWQGGCLVTITHTTVAAGTDTLGTITIVGTDLNNRAITEVMTPVADSTATSTKIFRSITSATGAGWVIAGGNDTIVIGVAAGSYVAGSGGVLHSAILQNSVAATVVLSDKRGTIATIPASVAAGTEYLYDLEFAGWLKVATTNTNDVTVIHTGTVPTSYATA